MPRPAPRLHRLVAAMVIAAALAACAQVQRPTGTVADPVRVYLIDYGRHTSVALPEGAGLTEWFWGDWNWFALRNEGLGDGLAALFASDAATLGFRPLPASDDVEGVRRAAGAASVTALSASRARVAALTADLRARYDRNRHTQVVHGNGRHFVREPGGGYSLGRNSNHAVADPGG